jgi:hypothetical protein
MDDSLMAYWGAFSLFPESWFGEHRRKASVSGRTYWSSIAFNCWSMPIYSTSGERAKSWLGHQGRW